MKKKSMKKLRKEIHLNSIVFWESNKDQCREENRLIKMRGNKDCYPERDKGIFMKKEREYGYG